MKRTKGAQIAFGISLVIFSCGGSIYAQSAAGASGQSGKGGGDSYELKRGDNEFGLFGGTSLNTPTLIGATADAHLTLFALRYGRVLGTKGSLAFEYTIDGMPVAVLSNPRLGINQVGPGTFSIQTQRESVYGAGISPVGFKFNFRRKSRAQPFASTSGGFLYFAKQVPVTGASQFNFTFDFTGGVQIFLRPRKAVSLGYQFRHVSNGGTAQLNPGVDANMIFAGFSIFK